MIQKVEEPWARGKTASALLMDVKGAFPKVAKENVIRKIEHMGFEADVCRWVKSLLLDR
jgi:hypothetical protein